MKIIPFLYLPIYDELHFLRNGDIFPTDCLVSQVMVYFVPLRWKELLTIKGEKVRVYIVPIDFF